MSENGLWKGTKIVLIVDILLSLMWVLVLLVAPEIFIPMIYGVDHETGIRDRQLGIVFLAALVVASWCLKQNEWDSSKNIILFAGFSLLGLAVLEIPKFIMVGVSASQLIVMSSMLILFAFNMFVYFKEESQRK